MTQKSASPGALSPPWTRGSIMALPRSGVLLLGNWPWDWVPPVRSDLMGLWGQGKSKHLAQHLSPNDAAVP